MKVTFPSGRIGIYADTEITWTPEALAEWVKDRQSASQGNFDKQIYIQPEDKSYATFHWLWILGLPGGEKDNFNRSKVKT